jgi:hypothetical protein
MDWKMETHPPEVMERFVRGLLPPDSREPVSGDLRERYVSPVRYLLDALRTVPFLIASRIRRTQHPAAILFLALFLWFAVFYGNTQPSWLIATLPTMAGIAALVLRDVYRMPGATRSREVAMDIAVYAASIALSQGVVALVAPDMLISKAALFVGFPLSCMVLFFLRLQRQEGVSMSPAPPRSVSLEELTQEIRTWERQATRAVRIEIGACFMVIAIFALFAWMVPDPVAKAGHALIVAGAAWVAWFLRTQRRARPVMPADLDFAHTVSFHEGMLARAARLSRTYLWWYIVPLSVGPLLLFLARAIRESNLALGIGTVVFYGLFAGALVKVHFVVARRLERRLDQLATLEEKP